MRGSPFRTGCPSRRFALELELAPRALVPSSERPCLVIEPGRLSLRNELRELLVYRDLLYFLVRRDLAVRYRQTFLGVAWAVLQPLLTMVVFTIFLGRLAGVPSDGVPYPLFAYIGLLPWMYFSSAVSRSSASLVGHANLLSKVYFPRLIIPLSATLSALADFLIALVFLLALLLWFGVVPAASSVILPLLIAVTAVLALGVGTWLATLSVRYRDVQHATPFLMQSWLFLTPVVYPSTLVPEAYRFWYELNPMAGVVSAYRAAVLGTALDWGSLAWSTGLAVVFLVAGIWQFRKVDRQFADLV